MADKKPRKPPEPQGLTIKLPLAQTEELLAVAPLAGHTTREQLINAAVSWLLEEGVALLKARFARQGMEKAQVVLGDAGQGKVELPRTGGTGLTNDGGIPLVPIAE